VASRGLS